MFLKNIKAKNFKNFKELDVEFNSLNLLVGANASGKSNFIQLFKFLKDLSQVGINNALSLQGDIEFFKNIGNDDNQTEIYYHFISHSKDSDFKELIYHIQFYYDSKINLQFEKVLLTSNNNKYELLNQNCKLSYQSKLTDEKFPKELISKKINKGNCLAQILVDVFDIDIFKSKIYDFDVKKAKLPSTINDLIEIKENGSNLSIVLRHLFKNENHKNTFINLVQQALPFIKDVNIENYFNENLVINLQESYYKDIFLPSTILSDGTIVVFCLVIAMFFDESKIKIFEEPERALHPYLISRVVSLFYDSSRENQIFLSTHNPEMLKCVKLEDIYLISRNENGFSSIKKINELDNAKVFLQNDLGIDEIISSSLLD